MGKFIDLSGQKFGRLTVIDRGNGRVRNNGKSRTYWNCVCDCGKYITVNADALTRGIQVSCGCYKAEMLSAANKKHGKTNTRLYTVYHGIKARCYNENIYEYRFYGQRGIKMCDEWKNDFQAFYDWMMEHGYDENAPRGKYTIDRIDCDGDYEPKNCRLVTQLEQANNLRSNHRIEYNGELHTIAEWSRITGINQFKIRNRIVKLGWTAERALTTA